MLKKLRDITPEEWEKMQKDSCYGMLECCDCIFKYANCSDGDDAWVYHKDMYSDKFLDQEIEIEMPHKTIPRGTIDSHWKWIARDADGSLFAYATKPHKDSGYDCWTDGYVDGADFTEISNIEELIPLMKDILWEDIEPTMIED